MIELSKIDIEEAVETIDKGVPKHCHYHFLKWYARYHSRTIFAAIASILGVSRSTLSNWLNGHNSMSPEVDKVLDKIVARLKEKSNYPESADPWRK